MLFLSKSKYFFISLFICFFLSACSSIFGKHPSSPDSGLVLKKALLKEQIARNDQGMEKVPASSEAYLNYILGELYLSDNKLEKALDYFEEVSEIEQGKASTLRRRLAQIYLQKGEIDSASEELAFGLEDDTEDLEYLQLYGGVLVAQKKYDEAIKIYEKISKISPKAYEHSLILIANAYEQKGENEKAKSTLSKIIKQNPNSVFAYYYRARLNESLKKNKLAEKDFLKALEFGGSDGIRYDYARFLALNSDQTKAKTILQEIIANNPSHVKSKNLLARILLRENKVEDALVQFESLSEIETDPSSTRLKIAVIKLEQQDFTGAERELRLVLGSKFSNDNSSSDATIVSQNGIAAARYYLGTALSGQKKNKEAVKELLKIDDTSEYFFESRVLSAIALKQLNEEAKAAKILSSAIDSNSIKENTIQSKHLLFLASLHKDSGAFAEAEKTYGKLIKLEPKEARHHFALGVLFDKGKKHSRSEAAMEKAISLDPDFADALNYLGYSLTERNKKLPYAEVLIAKAVNLEPKNGYYLDSLGWVYYKQGKIEGALTKLKIASELVPDDAVILEHLAIVQKESGLNSQSFETLMRAKKLINKSDDIEISSRIENLIKSLELDMQKSK